VIFHDADDPYEMVDMDDIFDNDMDTGDTMIAMPRHWNLTFRDINEGKTRLTRLISDATYNICYANLRNIFGWEVSDHRMGDNGINRVGTGGAYLSVCLPRGQKLSLLGHFLC